MTRQTPIAGRFSAGRWSAPLALLAILSLMVPSAVGQELSEGEPAAAGAYGGFLSIGSTPVRIWMESGGFGQESDQFGIGMREAIPFDTGVAFIDAQYNLTIDRNVGATVGLGLRSFFDNPLAPGSTRIAGASVWYDGTETPEENFYNQFGVSLESLGDDWDFRAGANLPFGTLQNQGAASVSPSGLFYSGNYLVSRGFMSSETAVEVVDVEIARRLGEANAWAFVGGYNLESVTEAATGYTVGVRGYLCDELLASVSYSDDDMFGQSTYVNLIFLPGRSRPNGGPRHTILDRLSEPVMRKNYVATHQEQKDVTMAVTDTDGNPIRIVHVDSTEMAPGGGDGTFEAPLVSLTDVFANSQQGDIVLMHSGTSHQGQTLMVRDEQRVLGEGLNQTHQIVTSQLGPINLPETAPGALAGPKPLVSMVAGDAIQLITATNNVSEFDPIEISNLTIDDVGRGIVSPTGVGAVNINRVDIEDTTGNAIELTPLVETLADSSTQVRFNPTIDQVTLTRVGGNGIDLDANTAEPPTTPVVEAIFVSNITSTDGAGRAIRINDNKSAATLTDIDIDGGATSLGGLLLTESEGGVSVARTTIANGAGPGVEIANSDAVFLFSDTLLTDNGNASLLVNGGAADIGFTGFIDQGVAAAAFLATGGHTGTAIFSEQTAGAGVINASDGTGLQFDNADGVYTFNHAVTLAGGDAGIDFINGSAAVATLANATITNPTGMAVNVEGGSASMSFTGSISQTNAVTAVSVNGGHTGTLIFSERTAGAGVISATDGDGLQFDNADGAYVFNHEVDLNGGDAGIDIFNSSSGTFTFSDLQITNPTGVALNINGSDATGTFLGAIANNAGKSVTIENNIGGSLTIGTTILDTGEGIDILNNTGGAFSFAGEVGLTTGASNGVTLLNNTGNSAFAGGLTIETTSGIGFSATNTSTVQVTGATNTIQSTTGTALSVNNSTIGAGGLNFQSVSSDGALAGIDLEDVTGGAINVGAGGSTPGDGGTIANSTDAGVRITNVENVSINNMIVDTTSSDGVRVTHDDANSSTVSIAGSTITNTSGVGLLLNSTGPGTLRLTVDDNSIDNTGAQGIGLNVGDNADTVNILLTENNVVNSSNNEALLFVGAGAVAKTVNLQATGNQFTNDSPGAAAADFQVNGAMALNATIEDNEFTNNNAVSGRPFEMSVNAAAGAIRLNINGNTATSAVPAGDDYFLIQTAGDFGVQDLGDIGANNIGTFNQSGTIVNDPGPIPTP